MSLQDRVAARLSKGFTLVELKNIFCIVKSDKNGKVKRVRIPMNVKSKRKKSRMKFDGLDQYKNAGIGEAGSKERVAAYREMVEAGQTIFE